MTIGQLGELCHQIWLHQLQYRQIDIDVQVGVGVSQFMQRSHRLVGNPLAQGDNQPGLFCQRDKYTGGAEPRWGGPAAQGFHHGDAVTFHIHDGLIPDLKLSQLQGFPQRLFQLHAL